jgi:two-component system nitrogen regulation sensor histidine kinase GlnL
MSEDGYRRWAAQLATGIALVDGELRLRFINPALNEALELGMRSLLGQSLGMLLVEPLGLEKVARLLVEQRPAQWRGVLLKAADGRDLVTDMALQPFERGLLLEVHVLAAPAVSASPLSATLRGFAHEVRNPLAGLRGAAQLLQRRVEGEDLQALAELVIDEADRLGALANRLLHHDGKPRFDAVNIHQLLEWLADLLQAEPDAPRLRHDYDPSVPDLRGDAGRLQQVLLNLARNAREAGAHALTLRTRIEHGVRLGERIVRMALRVDVIDDGAGVPPALRDTLFEPLVSGRADGNGLGLALSREIAKEHGGDLRCMSRPGETIFSLYLPLERAHD